MTKNMGKWSDKTINKLQSIIGEMMVGELVEAEVLYYVLRDEMGLSNNQATNGALMIFRGGYIIDANMIEFVTSNKSKAHQINSRQASRFMTRFMKSSRIQEFTEKIYKEWQMNGFRTEQPPYIAGYDRRN